MEPYVSAKNIDFETINQFVKVLKTCFGKVNPVGMTKHELYRLYQTNKNLELFLNIFLQLSKKSKINDSQTLDILYKKLSNELKNRLVTIKKVENLNNRILLFHDIDATMKKINKQSQLRVKPNASNFPAIKLPFKSYNSAPTKFSIAIGVIVVFPVPSTAIRTHPGFMDLSNIIRQGLILQEENDRCNNLGLSHYCSKPGHIAIDHRNPALLATKKQATDIFTGNLIALVPYKALLVKEKKTFLG